MVPTPEAIFRISDVGGSVDFFVVHKKVRRVPGSFTGRRSNCSSNVQQMIVPVILPIANNRVPTTLQNSFSLTFPDKMNNFS